VTRIGFRGRAQEEATWGPRASEQGASAEEVRERVAEEREEQEPQEREAEEQERAVEACSRDETQAGTTFRSPLSTNRPLAGPRWGTSRADTTSRSSPSTSPGLQGLTLRTAPMNSREPGRSRRKTLAIATPDVGCRSRFCHRW
jgi:hypothetical protein